LSSRTFANGARPPTHKHTRSTYKIVVVVCCFLLFSLINVFLVWLLLARVNRTSASRCQGFFDTNACARASYFCGVFFSFNGRRAPSSSNVVDDVVEIDLYYFCVPTQPSPPLNRAHSVSSLLFSKKIKVAAVRGHVTPCSAVVISTRVAPLLLSCLLFPLFFCELAFRLYLLCFSLHVVKESNEKQWP